LSLHFDDRSLKSRQERLQWNVGDLEINSMLHSYANTTKDFRILTDYGFIQFLPGFEDHFALFDVSSANDFANQVGMPNITEVLVPESGLPVATENLLRYKLTTGAYKIIGHASGHLFIKVK
jgi:hypothetical protein